MKENETLIHFSNKEKPTKKTSQPHLHLLEVRFMFIANIPTKKSKEKR